MLISKFNKLIHNKFVWAIFAVLVSISMVGLFAPSVGDGGDETSSSAGTLFGKPVPREELMRARLFVQAFQPSRGDEKQQQTITEDAWGRLAILKYAEKTGLQVSNEELGETIARDPSFAENGVFSRRLYQQLVESQMRIPLNIFEDYLREEILIQKVQNLAEKSLWISPYEIDQSVSRFTDRFAVDYIITSPTGLVADVALPEEQIHEFYDQNPGLFEAPEMRSVLFVQWLADDIATNVNVSETEIMNFYDRNIDQYSSTDSNTWTVVYTPLEEVEEDIRLQLAKEQAMHIAGENAFHFLDELSMVEYGDEVSMHSVAEDFRIPVYTSVLFNANDPVEGINADLEFNQAAFLIDPDVPQRAYSKTVFGDGAVYVLAWHTNQPSFLQPFDDVKQQAATLAEEAARHSAFRKRLNELHDKISSETGNGKSFREAAEAQNLVVQSIEPFSVYDAGPEDIPYFTDLMPAILTLSSGEVSKPFPVDEGFMIAAITERSPGDPMEAMSLKPDINRMLQAGRMRLHFELWADRLLAKARGLKPAVSSAYIDEEW